MIVKITKAKNLLIGGIVSREILTELEHSISLSHALFWQHTANDTLLFLLARGNHFVYREDVNHVLVVLGHVAYPEKNVIATEALEEIERHYHACARFPISLLEGSFALILLDKIAGIIIVYRNIPGLPPIYHSQTQKGAIFSDNLSILAKTTSTVNQSELKLNSNQLATYFMFGRVSGRETLFKNIFRVMPGEQACFRKNNVDLSQLQTFDTMIGPKIVNCVEFLECMMQEVISEYARTYPRLSNLFSGGVDSSYVQAHLTRYLGTNLPTFSVDLVHPSWTKEHEYARAGSEFFKSNHTFVEVDPLVYPSLLIEATAMLGEPVCHAQLVFIPELSRTAVQSTSVCMCGMAADTLFGTETCRRIDFSYQINRLIPRIFLRNIMTRMAEVLSKTSLSSNRLKTFHACLKTDLIRSSSSAHPFNTSERTNLTLMFDVFGRRKVTKAMYERRALLKQYQTTGNLKERLHSLYLLTAHSSRERFYQLASCIGLKLIFPYLDSRIVKAALSMDANCRFPFKQTKKVLKDALCRYLPRELVYRQKSAWGVPIFEWLRSGGVLSQLVGKINEYPFLKGKSSMVKITQGWFLWNLLTFDLWYKFFISPSAST